MLKCDSGVLSSSISEFSPFFQSDLDLNSHPGDGGQLSCCADSGDIYRRKYDLTGSAKEDPRPRGGQLRGIGIAQTVT